MFYLNNYISIGTPLGWHLIGAVKMKNWDVSGTGTSHRIGTFLTSKNATVLQLKIVIIDIFSPFPGIRSDDLQISGTTKNAEICLSTLLTNRMWPDKVSKA